MRANTSDITVSSLLQTETEDIVVAVSARKHSFAHFNNRIFSICNATTGVLLRQSHPELTITSRVRNEVEPRRVLPTDFRDFRGQMHEESASHMKSNSYV